ncbi:flippase [Winogradskyella immobilis]|uniref:Flippase n=1 Tax=Winogradskyella immobilis TaxID=2816852 RepID=A0ABS8EK55_9FLAO|nr:flippase [Winogradskyella immobilis]MCC1483480.1 flippase [Winogradskyella immobilis]MCG0015574.1 flippase [Winogradskyella immobilis]
MKINNKNLLNLIFGVFAKLFSGLKLALLGIIIARYLGPKDFGVFSYVISLVTLFTVFAEFRLQSILVRDFSEKKIKKEVLLGSALKICLFFATAGYILLSIVVFLLDDENIIKYFVLIYGLSYFFQIFRFLRAFFISKLLNKIIIRAELLTALIILLTGILFIYCELSIDYFIILRVFDVFLFSAILIFLYTISEGSVFKWKDNVLVRKQLIKDSFPLVLSGIAVVIFNRVDQIMLKHFINDYAVGQYSAAVSITGIISFIPIVLSESITPTLISKRMLSKKNYNLNRQAFSNVIIWGSLVLSIIVMLLSPIIINILYGKEYYPAIEVMKIFAFKGLFVAMGAVAAQIMIIEAVHQLAYIKSVVGGVVNIIFNYILILKLGMIGAVWASLLAFFFSSYITHYFIKRYRYIFWIQTKSLFFGWYYLVRDVKTLANIKN